MSQDRQGNVLGTPTVAQFILHSVAKTVRGKALVCDGFAEELHQRGRCSIIAPWLCEVRKDRVAILFSVSVLLQQLQRSGAHWDYPFGAFCFEPADAVWTQVDTGLLQVDILNLEPRDLCKKHQVNRHDVGV